MVNKQPLSVEQAQNRMLKAVSAVGKVGCELIPLTEAFGRVLAEPLRAKCSNPAVAVSAMDGIAVRHKDLKKGVRGGELKLVGESSAGGKMPLPIKSGEAVRIFTGAELPAGADTVIIQENIMLDKTKGRGVRLQLPKIPAKGDYVRSAGLDFKKGDKLAGKGDILSVRLIALLLAGEHVWVKAYRRPRVLILSAGNELVMPGSGKGVIASNALSLQNFVKMFGCEAHILPIADDNRGSILAVAKELHSADLVVSSGGASVGDYDLMRPVLQEHGLTLDFYKIAMRPGKPMMFGKIGGGGGLPYLGLPGNPVSVLVCSVVFLRSLLLKLAGANLSPLQIVSAKLVSPLAKEGGRQHYMRAKLTYKKGVLMAEPESNQDSSMLTASARADGFIVRPPHDSAKKSGQSVNVMLFPDSLYNY